MGDLFIGVLGPLLVQRAGQPLRVPGGRRRRVLAALVMQAGRPVHPDVLIEAGWGEQLPSGPKNALHTVLSRLRVLLGEEVLRTDPAGYVLAVPAEAVDAQRFEALCAMAVGASPRVASRLLDEALSLWRGAAYEDLQDDEPATVEAQRLELLRLDTIEARAALSLELDDAEVAVTRLESFVIANPFRERAVGLLMEALYRSGRQKDSLDLFASHRRRMAEELGLEPSPALQDIEARVLVHRVVPRGSRSTRRPERGAPPPPWIDTTTAFVGREDELADLMAAVEANRLVTVTGVGGVGKTRLVAQSLGVLAERLDSDIGLVELSGVVDDRVDDAVADALELGRWENGLCQHLLEYLSISDVLLVLDNCEHVLDRVTELVSAIGRRCPRVRVLTTSRRRLGLPAERVMALEPLRVTPLEDQSLEQLGLTDPIRLIADRARLVRPSFSVTGDNVATIAAICRDLDALPLALELVAARIAVLGADAVRDSLLSGLEVRSELSTRLHAVVDWSYRLLTTEQQRFFRLLSTFPTDFDLGAAEGVAAGFLDWSPRTTVADLVADLVDASLVSTFDAGGHTRLRMLAIVRSFAGARQRDVGEAPAAHQAHAVWVRRLVKEAASAAIGPEGATARASLTRHRGDIVAATRWATGAGQLPIALAITGAVGLCLHWTPDDELGALMVDAAERCGEGTADALALAAAALILADRGDLDRSRQLGLRAVSVAGAPRERSLAATALGVADLYAGDSDASARWWRRVTELDDTPLADRAEGHIALALLSTQLGDLDAARQLSQLATVAADAARAPATQAFARYARGEIALKDNLENGIALLRHAAGEAHRAHAAHVGEVARVALLSGLVRLGRLADAHELVVPLLHDLRRRGAWPQLWTTLRILAELFVQLGEVRDAMFVLAAATHADTAPPAAGDDVSRYDALMADLRCSLGDELAEGIVALGRTASRTQVLDRALAALARLSAL